MKDARKDWQKKAAAYPWAKCGTMTAETAKAWSAPADYSPSLLIRDYAKALGISLDEAKARIARQASE